MIYLDDGDVRLYLGDAATVLADLPEGSVDCCVTSPPYFGLRDYGTAAWEGGDPACDHMARPTGGKHNNGRDRAASGGTFHDGPRSDPALGVPYRGTCGKCGAVRHDVQIGLEPTPEEYVAALVAVFRQVWRVLAPWGTCWVNVGDSYAGTPSGQNGTGKSSLQQRHDGTAQASVASSGIARRPINGAKPKDLLMMPARLALALQADGWWVRSRIVWAKPNPMPESVTDRPTSAHEDIYLLTKRATYYYDAEAVREESQVSPEHAWRYQYGRYRAGGGKTRGPGDGVPDHLNAPENYFAPPNGRNLRNVWTIATEPTPEAHFATFPLELVRRCLAAGCPTVVCQECNQPGSACGHGAFRPGIVLDPFAGSGKTCQQARRMGLHAVGIDASEEYLGIAAARLQQLSLLGGAA